MNASTRIGADAYKYGQQQGQAFLANQQGLAGNLLAAGTSGLSQAQQASQLGQGSQQYGVQAPFLPFQQYGQTVSAQPTAQVPQFGQTKDPFATGAGLGVQAYSLFNQSQR